MKLRRCSGKTPTFLEKSPTFLGKCPTFFGKSPTFLDKSPMFLRQCRKLEPCRTHLETSAGRKEESRGVLETKMGGFEGRDKPLSSLLNVPKGMWCATSVKKCPKDGRKFLFDSELWGNRWKLWKQKVQNSYSARTRVRAREGILSIVDLSSV